MIKRTSKLKPIPLVEVLTQKQDNISGKIKRKVRLAARGDLCQVKEDEFTFSPTAKKSITISFSIGMKAKNCFVLQGDVPSAYLNGLLDSPIILYLPQGHKMKDATNSYVYSCPSSIYGLPASGRIWFDKFESTVKEIGLVNTPRDPCLFKMIENNEILYLQLYVDDFSMGSKSEKLLQKVENFLFYKFKVKCTSEVKNLLELNFTFTKKEYF